MSQSLSVKDKVASHPKLIGMLFVTMTFLTQVTGSAAAKINYAGP